MSIRLLFCLCQAVIQTLAWHGISEGKHAEFFPYLRESGTDYYLTRSRTLPLAMEVLDAAQKEGIKVFVSCPAMLENPDSIVPLLKNHPALAGYYIKDEPETWDLPDLGKLVSRISALDGGHPCYVNLYPNWAWGGKEAYASNLQLFADSVNVPFFSFDQYSITEADGKNSVRPLWYRNLEEMRNLSLERGKPFWAFALLESHYLGPPSPPAFYPVPTLGHLRLQAFSDLAYGAQVIQYYTFRGAVDKEGVRTPVFDLLKQVNAEIHALSPVFAGADVRQVWHAGPSLPDGTRAFEPFGPVASLQTGEAGLVASLVEKGRRQYLALVNKDCTEAQEISLNFSRKTKQVGKDGKRSPFRAGAIVLEPGDIILFEL